MAIGVVKKRKAFKIEYPAMVADDQSAPDLSAADRAVFNGTQRGHLNSLEMLPSYLALLAAAGVPYPYTASGLGSLYLVGRICYFKGYSSGVPDKRMNKGTFFMYFGILGLAITALKAAGETALKK